MSDLKRPPPETDCRTILHFLSNSTNPAKLARLVSRDYSDLCDEIAVLDVKLAQELVNGFGQAILGKQSPKIPLASPNWFSWFPSSWDELTAYLKRTAHNRFNIFLIGTGATLVANATGFFDVLLALAGYVVEESNESTIRNFGGWVGLAMIAVGIFLRLTPYTMKKRYKSKVKDLTVNAAQLLSQIELLQEPGPNQGNSIRGRTLRRSATNILAAKDPELTSSVGLLKLKRAKRFARYQSSEDLGISCTEMQDLKELLKNEMRRPRVTR